MFPYDAALAAAAATPVNSIAGVLQVMRAIDTTCSDADGLKWFNWLYMNVTEAVDAQVSAGRFCDPAWIADLDVQFARLYFQALSEYLGGVTGACPGCWRALFDVRGKESVARIQFAMAGINAHINHDLAEAIVSTCESRNFTPVQGTPQYNDYTNLNATLDSLIDAAKLELNVRLPGDALPPVSNVEDLTAAWGTAAAREKAWQNAEVLWHLRSIPVLAVGFEDSLDGLTTLAGKALLSAVL